MDEHGRKVALVSAAAMLALGLVGLGWVVGSGSSQAQGGTMHNCPQAGKWSIAVWEGPDGTDVSQALAACGPGAVAAAYYLDPETQGWLRWFSGRPEVSNLKTLNRMEGVSALGATVIPAPAPLARIAFVSDRDGDSEIYVMNADGTGVTKLTSNTAGDSYPDWSPDGSKIAFHSDRDGDSEIYVMNADGTGQTRLTNNSAGDWGAEWSPDGSKIAFGSGRDGNDEIYVMNADGTGQTRLTNNSAGDWGPAWSPDGSKIAFGSGRDGSAEVYVMNADGTGQTNLTNNPAWERAPTWSPDGSEIAFHSERDGDMEVYVMNADGSGVTKLTNNSVYDGWCSWAPEGSKIACHSEWDGNLEVSSMNVDGSERTRLTSNSAFDGHPAWSPGAMPTPTPSPTPTPTATPPPAGVPLAGEEYVGEGDFGLDIRFTVCDDGTCLEPLRLDWEACGFDDTWIVHDVAVQGDSFIAFEAEEMPEMRFVSGRFTSSTTLEGYAIYAAETWPGSACTNGLMEWEAHLKDMPQQ